MTYAEIGHKYISTLDIIDDARTFLLQLLAELDGRETMLERRTAAWLQDIAGWRREWHDFTAPNFQIHTSPRRPERIVVNCRAGLPDDAII